MKKLGLTTSVMFLLSISVVKAQLIFFDDFNQFPNGTVLTETNYIPGPWVPLGVNVRIGTNATGASAIASNLTVFGNSGETLFINGPVGSSLDYEAKLTSSDTNDLTAAVTNKVVDVQWLSWILNTNSSLTVTSGLAANITTTNLYTDAFTTNLDRNVLIFFHDNGNVYAFTNNSDNFPLPIVPIGSWSAYKGTTVMTNHLVLNYPASRFSFYLNGVALTNNMFLNTQYFTNLFTGVDLNTFENGPHPAGNKFALDDVQIVVTNAGKDVHSFIAAAKGQQFDQTSASTPSLTATGWVFHSEVQAVTTGSVWLAKVHFPGGGKTNLVQDSSDLSFWEFNDGFTLQTALDIAYSNGVYRLNILGLNQGVHESSLNLSGDSYPNTPQISNFAAGQAINASTNFTLQWNSSGGGTGDWVMLELDDALGNVVLSTPDFSETSALNGTNTSLVITAGTLQASSTYTGQLLFARPVATDTNSIPYAKGATAYFKQTEFPLATLPPAGPSCVLTPALATNDVGTLHAVTATITTNNSMAVEGVTVNFLVVSGPHTGTNGVDVTDGLGQAAFSYTGNALGTDTIQASGEIDGLAFTGTAVKVWLATNVPPVAVCKNITVSAGTNCLAIVTGAQVNNGSSDPDGGGIVSYVLDPPGPYSLGTNNVTLTVTDNRGGTDSCGATITVVDQTPPTITCSSNLVVVVPFGQANALVNFSAPVVSDNCSVSTNYCTPASGSTFPLGTNTVTCTAVDGSANTNTCSFQIIVTETPAQADLALTAASNVATASLNNAISYTLVVTNKGPQDAAGARLVDPLPGGVVYSNATSSAGTCTNIGGLVTCDFGALTNGTTATVSIVITPTNAAVTNVCNSVTVTNSLLDPVTANNSTNICTPVVIDNLAVTAFTAPKRLVLSARRTNVVSKLSVTIQNRALHGEVILSPTTLSNLVTITLSPLGANTCPLPVAQLVVSPRTRFPITLASGKSLKLAYTVNFTCATDPLATTRTVPHPDYQYLVTVHHEALNGQLDSRPADDTCPHIALGPDPYNKRIKDKGCGLKIRQPITRILTFTNVVTDIIDTRP